MGRGFICVFSSKIIRITFAWTAGIGVLVLLLFWFLDNFFLWFIEPNKGVLSYFSHVQHVLVWNFNQSDGGKVCHDAVLLFGKFGVLDDVDYLESKHWKAKDFLFLWIPRHGLVHLNLGWWTILFVEIDFKDEELLFLGETLSLWSFREAKSNFLISSARLECRPCSNSVSSIVIFFIVRTEWIKSSIDGFSIEFVT